MSVFRTRTPRYQGDNQNGEAKRCNPCEWIWSLMRTPTPRYRQSSDGEPKRIGFCDRVMSVLCTATPPYQQPSPDDYKRRRTAD